MGVNFSRTGGTEPTTSTHCPTDGNGSARDGTRDDMEKESGNEEEFFETQDEAVPRSHEEEMIEFKKELAIKREQRRTIIAKHTKEKENLRNSLELQIRTNQTINDENRVLRELLQQHNISVPSSSTNAEVPELKGPVAVLFEDLERFKSQNKKLRLDLTETNVSLQSANTDIINMQSQNVESMKQISALKEVVAVTKTLMKIRESQLIELKAKLSEIETSLADREASLLSTDLRAEYERQLQNIRTLRTLYEERARLAEVTRLQLLRELEEQKALAAVETSKCQDLTVKVEELEAKINDMSDAIDSKDDQISVTKEETRGLKAEMSTVNKLFSQMLLGYRSQQDLDTLVTRLQEHHGLLSHMAARETGAENSALPKLLLDLLSQVEHSDGRDDGQKPQEKEASLSTTAEEIVENLPKVWRVLMELLSHQSGAAEAAAAAATPTTCYKSVDTPTGPRMVPSVSQTYIRLKDLIVEKLSLTKEMGKMKQLNSHLETRLEQQERRLCLVTSELSKTWHVVGRLRRHHHQLHTHEKILRYELQQKRKMLNELKEELEFCREKWDKAREKNTESEKEWKKLRTEFSSRKSKTIINNSGESGYSDERQTEDDSTESNDESESLNDPPLRCKKWVKKNTEVLPDSITDPNQPAEREDPISDMLDVAELPLDGHDVEENVDKTCDSLKEDDDDLSVSDSCPSEMFANSQDSLASETSAQLSQAATTSILVEASSTKDCKIQDSSGSTTDNLEPTAACSSRQYKYQEIIDNVKKQHERLAKKDSRLESLEESSASLLNQVTKTAALRKEIDERLQKLHARATIGDTNNDSNSKDESSVSRMSTNNDDKSMNMANTSTSERSTANDDEPKNNSITETENITGNDILISPYEIMENIRKQNELLAKRDQRMNRLEEECSDLLKTSKTTLQVSAELENRLDDLHSARTSKNLSTFETAETSGGDSSNLNGDIDPSNTTTKPDPESCTENENLVEETINEPSTSSGPIDHEARFAARDERLKRLEEQTKSLVDKVNDTATKSVRITYKLEELHNIYGSEGTSSRNQSPSDDEIEEQHEGSSRDP